jgi:hypothetical protein
MTPEQFCYWLQGFRELTNGADPTPAQWKMIKEHLQTVFKKVTPSLAGAPSLNPNRELLPGGPVYGPYRNPDAWPIHPNDSTKIIC